VINPGSGPEVCCRVFRVDTALNSAPAMDDVILRERQPLAGSNTDLLLHQIDPRDQFRDGMFDLNTRALTSMK
jgi:hypothetical protein